MGVSLSWSINRMKSDPACLPQAGVCCFISVTKERAVANPVCGPWPALFPRFHSKRRRELWTHGGAFSDPDQTVNLLLTTPTSHPGGGASQGK